MIVSNEPGYYKTGAYGIRIENLVVVQPADGGGEREMLGFETLTLAPIDRNLVEPSLLDDDEIAWLDAYHARVRETLTPLVDPDTARWLAEATAADRPPATRRNRPCRFSARPGRSARFRQIPCIDVASIPGRNGSYNHSSSHRRRPVLMAEMDPDLRREDDVLVAKASAFRSSEPPRARSHYRSAACRASCAASQLRPSKNLAGRNVAGSMPSRQRALTSILSGSERGT